MRPARTTLLCLAALAAAPRAAGAAEDACIPTRLMVVLDKSSSMTGEIEGRSKWSIAAEAVSEVAGAYEDTIELGLDVFPEAGACTPGSVLVEPSFGSADAIAEALGEPPPEGGNYTPMAQTLEALGAEPSLTDPEAAPFAVLVTDGWQWCDPYDPATRFDPVDAVAELSDAGITTFVVGFGDAVDPATLNMMAVMSGTERPGCDPTGESTDSPNPCYYQADDPAELVGALMDVAGQIPEEESCDGTDEDCDGSVDESVVRACESDCGAGMQICESGAWSACDAPTTCEPEEPEDAGMPNSGCACDAGAPGAGGAALLLLALLFGRAILRRRRCS